MKQRFWESTAVLRVHAVIAAIIVLTGAGVLACSQLKLVSGVKMTLETTSAEAMDGRVLWTASPGGTFSESQSVSIRIPKGRGRVIAFLPVRSKMCGLRVEAPGVELGAVDLVGGNGRLRADTFADLAFDVVLRPRRFPKWSR